MGFAVPALSVSCARCRARCRKVTGGADLGGVQEESTTRRVGSFRNGGEVELGLPSYNSALGRGVCQPPIPLSLQALRRCNKICRLLALHFSHCTQREL